MTASLTASQPSLLQMPSAVTIPGGQETIAFQVTPQNVTAQQDVMISAVLDGRTVQAVLMVSPN